MFKFSKKEVVEIATRMNFVTNTVEKMLRLKDVLIYLNESSIKDFLALKGGTAINLCILDLKRLSVDIDLDFTLNCSKDEMLKYRKVIDKTLKEYMSNEGYELSNRSKSVHSLDSYVYSYETLSNSKDILKIEINYSDRCHVFDEVVMPSTINLDGEFMVKRLSDYDLIASKFNALIDRTVPRDLYDAYGLITSNKIKDLNLLKKCIIFYLSINNGKEIDITKSLNECFERIDKINYHQLKVTVIPVINKRETLQIEEMKQVVKQFLTNLLTNLEEEKDYINSLNNGIYDYKLLFKNYNVNDLSNHPMMLWKINN